MKELSLNILDIAENSVKAKAPLTQIILTETEDVLTIEIIDNGCGMTAEVWHPLLQDGGGADGRNF